MLFYPLLYAKNPQSNLWRKFYSAFGGVNGTIGEDHRFVIDVPPECEEICFYRYGTFDKILYRDAETGQWMRVE